ncbi:hypothetical protein [Chitinophaga sp. MM2321]|uniref:hypothetical protein n=1 Tax=Chitinophaga sp. MM2321 TaxID=3137178 RepID=UPI0032D58D77
MQILSKKMTTIGSLEISWLDGAEVRKETFSAEEVQFFMFQTGLITDADKENVDIPGEGRWSYIYFLQSQLTDQFCENLINTNTITK